MSKEELLQLIAELTKENMQLREQLKRAKGEADIWLDLYCRQRGEARKAESGEQV